MTPTRHDQRRIEQRARPDELQRRRGAIGGGLLLGDGVVADQAARAADLAHDLVAGIDAQRALDALELRAVADVDARRADGDAGLAVDAVAAPLPGLALLVGAARLAAIGAVAHQQRLVVDHGALDARPGAHVDADLLAGDAAEHVGRQREDAEEQVGDGRRRAGQELVGERRRVAEIEHEGAARGQADGEPGEVRHAFPEDLDRPPRCACRERCGRCGRPARSARPRSSDRSTPFADTCSRTTRGRRWR